MFSIFTCISSKNFALIGIFLLSCISGFAQTLQWSKLSDVHSATSMAGIQPNSLMDQDGNIIYVSVENDILSFYKFDENGNEIGHFNTAQTTGAFSKLIQLSSGDFAIAFDMTPLEVDRTIKILTFNKDLELIQNQKIELPFSAEACILSSIFEVEGELFLSIFNWEEHFILKIVEGGATEIIFTGSGSFAAEAKINILLDQSLLIEYQYGTGHMIRRVSISEKQLLWEHEYLTAGRIEMQYKTIPVDEEWIAMAAAERDWVDGEARDTVRLKKINIEDGSVILETFWIPDNHCITHLSDFKFNPISRRFYISFAGCFPSYNLSLLELDNDFNFLQTDIYDVNADDLFMHDPAYLHILPDGKIVFAYKNKKDSLENGNLYFTLLNEDLSFGSVLELNFAPKNSSESISDIVTINDHKILFTGSIPDSQPHIFWEQVQFFTVLIDFENATSIESIHKVTTDLEVFPNPVNDVLSFKFDPELKEILIHHISGQLVFRSANNFAKFLNVEFLPAGMYTITIRANSGPSQVGKFLKAD